MMMLPLQVDDVAVADALSRPKAFSSEVEGYRRFRRGGVPAVGKNNFFIADVRPLL